MSARSFRSVGWVAAVAATALGCYMVNLKVASERASLEDVETRIVLAQRDIRLLQTEIGTRGRLAQLEKWNVKVLALSAPAANQFVEGGFQLATLVAPQKTMDPAAPVVLASAPAPDSKPVLTDDASVATAGQPATPADMMHVASLKRDVAISTAEPKAKRAAEPKLATSVAKKPVEKPAAGNKAGADKPAKAGKAVADSAAKVAKPKLAESKPTKAVSAMPAATKTKTREAKADQ